MTSSDSRDHYLTLKMHRLSKPSFTSFHPVECDLRDGPGRSFLDAPDITQSPVPVNTSQVLQFPSQLGNVYLGETFSFYVTISNESHQQCKDVVVKIDLQTTLNTHFLSSGNPPLENLDPDSSADIVLNHEVKEIGVHNVIVHVSYITLTGEKFKFKKNTRFQVLKPLEVKTYFFNPPTFDIYLQAQVQNITPVPMVMEKVIFEPSSNYKVEDLNTADYSFDGVSYMNSMDTRQYIYKLTPIHPHVNPRGGDSLTAGKLDFTWRSQMGERGRLQTSNLVRRVINAGEIKVTAEQLPTEISAQKPFSVTLQIVNCSERLMQLVLHLVNSEANSLRWLGISGKNLGSLDPGGTLSIDCILLSSYAGLHSLDGFKLVDSFLRRTYEFNNITNIYVVE